MRQKKLIAVISGIVFVMACSPLLGLVVKPSPVSVEESVDMVVENPEVLELSAILKDLGAKEEDTIKISKAIIKASTVSGIDRFLLASLMKTESGFSHKAVSPKYYRGLMQIPYVLPEEGNVIVGALILKEKMGFAKGNMRAALAMYKGWKPTDIKGQSQVNEVLRIYTKVKERRK